MLKVEQKVAEATGMKKPESSAENMEPAGAMTAERWTKGCAPPWCCAQCNRLQCSPFRCTEFLVH